MKKKLYILFALLVVTGVPAGLYFFGFFTPGGELEGAVDEDGNPLPPEEPPPIYLPLEPPFVVNFMHQGTLRYLQVSLEVMYRDPEWVAKVEERMPAIRNDVILLLSNREFEDLYSMTGKESLRNAIREIINTRIKIPQDSPDKGEIYLTHFVMQ